MGLSTFAKIQQAYHKHCVTRIHWVLVLAWARLWFQLFVFSWLSAGACARAFSGMNRA